MWFMVLEIGMCENRMKKEYDFTKAERGKFYHKNLKLRLPIYLSLDLQNKLERLAREKHQALSDVVNRLLKKEIRLDVH